MACIIVICLLGMAVSAPQYGPPTTPPPSPTTTPQPFPAKLEEVASPVRVCPTVFSTVWDTEYHVSTEEKCSTVYHQECRAATENLCQNTTRTECRIVTEQQCNIVYKKVCVDEYKTEYEPYVETECSTEFKEDCEYSWQHVNGVKVWAPIHGTCKTNPFETCEDV